VRLNTAGSPRVPHTNAIRSRPIRRASRGTRVLGAQSRARGDPAGRPARAGERRRGGPHASVRRQPRHETLVFRGGVPPSQHVAMRSREVEKFSPRPRACETRPGQAGVVRSGGGNRGRPARRNSDRTTRHPHHHHRQRRQQARRAPTPSLARSKYPVRARESLIGEPSGNARRLTSSALEYVGSRNVVTDTAITPAGDAERLAWIRDCAIPIATLAGHSIRSRCWRGS
jgi:hypothetical protein